MGIKKIMIAGCGWLGEAVALHFEKLNFEIWVTTRSEEKAETFRQRGWNVIHWQFINNKVVFPGNIDFSQPFHLIVALPPSSFENYGQAIDSILRPFHPNSSVIFCSSTGIYPDGSYVADEEAEILNDSPLAQAENAVKKSGKKNYLLRLAGLIGPKRHPAKFFADRENIPNGNAPVNLIQQEDVVSAILQIIKEQPENGIYNLCFPDHPTRSTYYSYASKTLYGKSAHFLEEGEGKLIIGEKIEEQTSFRYKTDLFDLGRVL
jgi:nucleoside-diphosphate-sugar epimerase